MYSRHILFVRGRPWSGLAPILAALLSVVSLALLGVVVALWPPGPGPSAARPVAGQAASGSRPQEGVLSVPVTKRESVGRTRGI
jgi:hypothetical protein